MSPSNPALLTSWEPPPWATSTVPRELSVVHSRARSVAGLLPDPDDSEPTGVDVRLVQVDAVQVGDHGDVRVVRAAPSISVEEHRFTLDGAAALADALAELVELARGQR